MDVRCKVILQAGRQCRRLAEKDSEVCSYHRLMAHKREEREFYSLETLPKEDVAFAAEDLGLEGFDAEIAVMRVLIRRMVARGDHDRALRGIETLLETLKAADRLDRGSSNRMEAMLDRVLDQLGEELGWEL